MPLMCFMVMGIIPMFTNAAALLGHRVPEMRSLRQAISAA